MGKHKLHGQTFYQCDWTGFPMQQLNCYMPTWNKDCKLVKQGSYCNWESVVAHARQKCINAEISEEELEKVTSVVKQEIGCVPTSLVHFTNLQHFGGEMTQEEYNIRCSNGDSEITGILMDTDGKMTELRLASENGVFDWSRFLGFEGDITWNHASLVKKHKKSERTVDLFYWPKGKYDKLNANCSVLKMQIYGPVLLVVKKNENSFDGTRERYCDFVTEEFEEMFSRKRKKTDKNQAQAMTTAQYDTLKSEMQTALNDCEAKMSSSAQTPMEIAMAAKMPQSSGKELAAIARLKALEKRLVDPAPQQLVAVA